MFTGEGDFCPQCLGRDVMGGLCAQRGPRVGVKPGEGEAGPLFAIFCTSPAKPSFVGGNLHL